MALVSRVRELNRDGQLLDAADLKVTMTESDKRKVHQMLVVGLRCAHHVSSQRPTIGQAIHDLLETCIQRHLLEYRFVFVFVFFLIVVTDNHM